MRIWIHFISVQQEDPYKLVLLAKDTKRVCATNADFFFTNGELSFVTGDEEGIIRVYEYNPQGTFDSISIPRRVD
jgi:cleavage and polyadenylation specificity factor subunit 1